VNVHTIYLIGGTTLYCVLSLYTSGISSSHCPRRSCGLFPLCRLSRSDREGVRIHNNR